jgi:hypothetical protein
MRVELRQGSGLVGNMASLLVDPPAKPTLKCALQKESHVKAGPGRNLSGSRIGAFKRRSNVNAQNGRRRSDNGLIYSAKALSISPSDFIVACNGIR